MYKFLKSIFLSIIPKSLMQQLEWPIRYIIHLMYWGNEYSCPISGLSNRKFITVHSGNKLSPFSGSLERSRLLWLYLMNEFKIDNEPMRVLHFAPQKYMVKKLKGFKNLEYITCDITGEGVDKAYDITSIPEEDNSFELVICYHVLEHVLDDKKAMSEILRILKPGGKAILQVPFREGETLENPVYNTPELRLQHFGQEDHVRWYNHDDFLNRLTQAGFTTNSVQYAQTFSEEERERFGLNGEEKIILALNN